jgi:ABC-type branched-subunit amino acid transport system substrate-binding protein
MKKFFVFLVFLLVFISTFVFASSQTDAEGVPGVTDTEILIGFTMPMSGPIGFIGSGTADAVNACFQKYNDMGGIYGRKLKLITYDSGMDAAQALANYRKLVLEDKAFAVLFGFSFFIRPAYPFLEEQGVPWLFPMAPPNDAMFPAQKYLFSLFPTTATQLKTTSKWLVDQNKYPRVAAIYGDSASGKTGLEGLKKDLAGTNIKIVAAEAIKQDAASAAVQVAKIRKENPDIVLLFGYTMQPAATCIKEIKKVGWDVQMMVNMPITNEVLLKLLTEEEADGLLGAYWGAIQYLEDKPEDSTPEMQAAAKTILKYYPKSTNVGGLVEHYLSVELFIEALKRAGEDLTREKLIEAMETFKDYPTGKGSYATFSPTRREGISGGIITQVKDNWWVQVSDWINVDLDE